MAAFVSFLRVSSLVLLAMTGQVEPEPGSAHAPSTVIEAETIDKRLHVFDRPDEASYIICTLRQGDRVRVSVDRSPGTGWLAIEPPPTAICWIEEAALELDDEVELDIPGQVAGPEGESTKTPLRAWVSADRAVLRSGHPQAILPGPPRGTLGRGTLIQLVDRPPLAPGRKRGSASNRWRAIVPPPGQVYFVPARGVRWITPHTPPSQVAEIRAGYEESAASTPAGPPKTSSDLPEEFRSEIERLDAIQQAIISSQPIEQWRFETVRDGYQALLKRSSGQPTVEAAIRARLARVTRDEQASQAARKFRSILAESHRRDREIAQHKQTLARAERARARAFDAVGFIQPSARKVNGHKIFALIGGKGSTIAYLDIPPGLDPQPLLARRVGVRGQARFSEDLGTRLISVRDMESIEPKR